MVWMLNDELFYNNFIFNRAATGMHGSSFTRSLFF